jgi:hypothetical protein
VDDAVLVGVGEGRRHRGDGRDDLARAEPAAPGQQGRETAAGQQFQHEGDAGNAAALRLVHHLEQPDEMRMVELAEQGRLARLAFRVARHQDLDRHRRPTPPGHRPPHLAGAAAPQPLLERVPGHHRRGLGGADGSRHVGDRRPDAPSAAGVVHRPGARRAGAAT